MEFFLCSSLIFLPDISKWNTRSVENMRLMLNGCATLSIIPGISKWDTSNLIDISNVFRLCKSLAYLQKIKIS